MIISHKYKFVFIKTGKTAGTSIEVFLSGVCGEEDIVTPIIPHEYDHRPRNHQNFYNHMPAKDIKSAVGEEVWNSYFKFCVERNPWDKTLSSYHWHAGESDFDAFVKSRRLPVDRHMYLDENQNMMADRVVRYERLNEELLDVFCLLGVPFPGMLAVRAKGGHRKDKRHYGEIYTTEQAEIVAECFKKEICMFGYSFR